MVGGRRRTAALVGIAAGALLLSGCAVGPSLGGAGIVVGTALHVAALDPAASAGAGGELVSDQIYPRLVTVRPGTADRIVPDIAKTAAFDAAGDYVVTLRPDLRFANGDVLDSSDVVFSFTRQRTIATPGGPSPLLAGVASVTARDQRTVVFHLTKPHDTTFPAVLTSPVGAIVDEQVFPAKSLLPDVDIVAARPFAGPYTLQSYNPGDLLTFRTDPDYAGALGTPRSDDVTLKLYADPANMAADVADGAIDVAYGGIGPSEARSLDEGGAELIRQPGGALRYLVFDLATMPYGTASRSPSPDRALAVRQAAADLIDRRALADDVFAGTASPLWGFIPDGAPGAEDILQSTSGNGEGRPDYQGARGELDAADVDTPVPLRIAIEPDRYGAVSHAEYDLLTSQLENGGLFAVTIVPLTSAEFGKQRGADSFAAFQGGWSPRGLDPTTYRTSFLLGDAQLHAHFTDAPSLAALAKAAGDADPKTHRADLHLAQQVLAASLPVLPLVQDEQLAATADGIQGVVFDGSQTLRFGSLHLP